jgi:hypothetical protein
MRDVYRVNIRGRLGCVCRYNIRGKLGGVYIVNTIGSLGGVYTILDVVLGLPKSQYEAFIETILEACI